MSRGRRCTDCGRPGAYTCGPCGAEKRRLNALHGYSRPAEMYPLAALLDRAVRVELYRRRAARRLPLFD